MTGSAGPVWAGETGWAGAGLLILDQAVSDRLGGGQRAAAARVLADLVHLAARHVGQPEVQRVEHPGYLLLTGGERGHGTAELQLRLGESEGRVRVAGPARAGGEHAQGGSANFAAYARVHRRAQDVEDAHDGENGGEFGPQV